MSTLAQDAEFAADCLLVEIVGAIVRLERIYSNHPAVIAARIERLRVAREAVDNLVREIESNEAP